MPVRPSRTLAVVALLVVCAVIGGIAVSRRSTQRPHNVIILLWDTVRADRLSLYGHPRNTTPHLDGFAAEALVFDQAISPGVWTVPVHGSLFTGLPVSSHGAGQGWTWLDERFTTLAELLGAAGYDTWAWSTNPYLAPTTNLLQGFDTIELAWQGTWAADVARANREKRIVRDRSTEVSPSWRPTGHGQGWPRHLATHKDAGPIAHTAFVDWLDHREAQRPFFAYLGYMEAHHPRMPTLQGRMQVLSEEPELLEQGLDMDASMFRMMSAMEGHDPFSDSELEAIRAVYDASLADLDEATHGLLEALRVRGVLDDTVVIIVGDHGEHLGEHGMFDHRWSVRQPLIRVPLVVRHPDLPPGRITEPVSTRDLFFTVCDIAGVTPPVGIAGQTLLGPHRAAPIAELGEPARRLGAVRRAYPDLDPNRWNHDLTAIVDGDDKLVRDGATSIGLYDLGRDPGEDLDQSASDPRTAERLRSELAGWSRSIPTYDPGLRAPGDSPGQALRGPGRVQDQLRALGYVDD